MILGLVYLCDFLSGFLLALNQQEQSQAQLELKFLEALEIYPPGKLKGM